MHVQFELHRCYILHHFTPQNVQLYLKARHNSARVTLIAMVYRHILSREITVEMRFEVSRVF